MLLHAHWQGLDPPGGQETLKRSEVRPEVAAELLHVLGIRFAASDYASQDVGVAGQVLGHAVNDHCCTGFERTAHYRRRKRRIHDYRHSALGGHLGDRVDLRHPQERVGNGLDQDAASLGLVQRGLEPGQVARVGEARQEILLLHQLQQLEGLAEQHVGRQNRLRPVAQGGEQSDVHRGHARTAR